MNQVVCVCVCVCSFTDLVHCYHSVQSDSSSDSDSEEEKQRSRRDSDQNRPQGRGGRWRADRDSRKGIPLTPGVFIDCASETNISRRILCGSQRQMMLMYNFSWHGVWINVLIL